MAAASALLCTLLYAGLEVSCFRTVRACCAAWRQLQLVLSLQHQPCFAAKLLSVHQAVAEHNTRIAMPCICSRRLMIVSRVMFDEMFQTARKGPI
jgi:hypothetical protein